MSIELIEEEYEILHQGKTKKLKEYTNEFISFHIAFHRKAHQLVIALHDNENSGLFSKEWLPLDKINALLSNSEMMFRSQIFNSLFKSKSKNNCGFLTAVLMSQELGLIRRAEGYQYQYTVIEDYAVKFKGLLEHWLTQTKRQESEKTDRKKAKAGQ